MCAPRHRAHAGSRVESPTPGSFGVYISDREGLAAALKSALEAAPESADLDRVWGDVWIARVFEGREPTMDQVKREPYEYWELLERLGE